MGRESGGLAPYDAAGDAERIAGPMRQWASSGFFRGLAGVRAEILPRGSMCLPSSAFFHAATACMNEGNPDGTEAERRLSYLEDVGERVRAIQSECIERHYRSAAWGQVCDFGIAVMVLVLMVGLLHRVGVYHPLTIGFLVLFAAKLAFMHLAARRLALEARKAFKARSEDVSMPWQARGGPSSG